MFDPNLKCPLIRKKCIKHDCCFYIALRGSDPQTGAPIDEWGCAYVWNVVATLEGSNETRRLAADVESLRNELNRVTRFVAAVQPRSEVRLINAQAGGDTPAAARPRIPHGNPCPVTGPEQPKT